MEHGHEKSDATTRPDKALVESALMLPLVLLLLFGMGNFLLALHDKARQVSDSDETARAGVSLVSRQQSPVPPNHQHRIVLMPTRDPAAN